jgi:DNA mismatch repair ATPase MutS
MAGKSTFLRQNALLSILAQAGCYVPADHAEMSVVDHIFSRVGSADNLYQDQSTFMVEMLETAGILRGATERSLVVMDEVGRGTNPRDGEAVAWAVAEELRARGCRCLFATHFEGVAKMLTADANERGEGERNMVGFYCTDVLVQPAADKRAPEEENWVFVHKLRKGVNHESHALRVARLARMPRGGAGKGREGVEGEREIGGFCFFFSSTAFCDWELQFCRFCW